MGRLVDGISFPGDEPAGGAAVADRLLTVGHALFVAQGYHATGIQEITERAQVPKGSFYNHFASKEDFAAQVLQSYTTNVNRLWDSQLERLAGDDALAQIQAIFQHFTSLQDKTGGQGCLVGNLTAELAESSEPCRAVLAAAIAGWHDRLSALLARAQGQGTVRQDVAAADLAALFWDSWEGAQLRMKVGRSVQPLTDVVHLLVQSLLRPLTPHQEQ